MTCQSPRTNTGPSAFQADLRLTQWPTWSEPVAEENPAERSVPISFDKA
jgi:hypothetical protein